jgi:hypothetical protein
MQNDGLALRGVPVKKAYFSLLLALAACGSGNKETGDSGSSTGDAATGSTGDAALASTGDAAADAKKDGTSGSMVDARGNATGDAAGSTGDGASGATGGDGAASTTGGSGTASTGDGGTASTGGGATGSDGGSNGTFANFQQADVVIGQADFTSNAAPSLLGAATTDYAFGSAAFDGQRLFVPDTYSQRALGFAAVPTTNGASATTIFGQASASTKAPGTTMATWYLPRSLHTDGTTLAVADSGNHRVLLLPTSAASGAAATTVVGWPDGNTPSTGCSSTSLRSPASAFIVSGKLLVADRRNNRVLIWNTLPTSSGAAADVVLGQGSMTSCAANDSLHNGTSGVRAANTLQGPADVWSDGTRVLVADRDNNRVLVWSHFPTSNGIAADLVIGQPSFTVARDSATPNVLLQPSAVAYDGDRLFIADAGHNRVLGWNAFPSANGAAADLVLGQGDFTHVSANDDAQSGTDGTAPTRRTLSFPSGVAFAGNSLIVSDTQNRRFLVFRRH